MQRIGIFGASGYAGIELTRLLAAHGGLTLAFAASERQVGTLVGDLTGVGGELGRVAYVGFEAAREAAKSCAVVFLCTPPEVSKPLAAELVAAGVRVVDLSNAFRLGDGTVYGLTEVNREAIRTAQLVANPGCYATAATLPLVPLLRAGLVQTTDVVVDGVSGASGAGRRNEESYSLVEMHDNVRAYKVMTHQHQPEIAQSYARAAGAPVDVVFIPKILPFARGILATITTRLAPGVDPAQLLATLRAAYEGEPFVRVCARAEDADLHAVVGTNLCALGVTCVNGRVVLLSAIDNLVKGAAGQALQNANLMLGLPETTGLVGLRRFLP
jgi:N-acetyl-gamma-glutamyl-phosphate reductase